MRFKKFSVIILILIIAAISVTGVFLWKGNKDKKIERLIRDLDDKNEFVRINAVAAAQVTVQVGLYGAAVRAWRFLWVHWGANPSAP